MSDTSTTRPAHASGTFPLGGDLPVHRLGFGTMQLTGRGVWGPPADPDEAVRVLRRAVELGVDFIDTADSYGPDVAEPLIKRALHPYPTDLVIATKAGFRREGPNRWTVDGDPARLRHQAERSLQLLGVDRIDLFQLHRIDRSIPLEDQVGELKALHDEGKIRHIGLSEVSIADIEAASRIAPIVSVQNEYNLANRSAESLVDYATRNGIGFIPWFPLATGALAQADGPLTEIARRTGATPSQLALAWLLRRSPAMLPIPGTSQLAHVDDNVAAAAVELTDAEYDELTEAVR
ncbi:oxidoreductase [Agromyces protaetiae]|uniref:Oxidoreductase n=1 Tax=Agromyces protaetiae TaxID=2509455 RepID=A0A4P6FE84_9MICO|nr:aldo/keto reductase [Agromyces protaetiae]QAY71987.1 oxidoreductase [Agromyces protaetiae]